MFETFINEIKILNLNVTDFEGVIRALQEFLVIKCERTLWIQKIEAALPIFRQFANDQLILSSSEMLSLLVNGWTDHRQELIEQLKF